MPLDPNCPVANTMADPRGSREPPPNAAQALTRFQKSDGNGHDLKISRDKPMALHTGSRYSPARREGAPQMPEAEQPQIYLITPPEFELGRFPQTVAAVLDAVEVACLRLSLASHDEDRLGRAADALREVAHARDVAMVIDTHVMLAERHGLDGVHLHDNGRNTRLARQELGSDAIVGAFCGASRHDGMNAGEAGADYISFGPVGTSALGDGTSVDRDVFAWWSQMIELPVVAEGALNQTLIRELAPVTDFFGIGSEIWSADDPVAALKSLHTAMKG